METDFSNIFLKCYQFEENFDEEDERMFENNGTNSTKYVKAISTQNNQEYICKVFNPDVLQRNLVLNSDNKNDQSWYRQLILLREIFFLKKNHHPTIVNFKGSCLYNSEIGYDDDYSDSDSDDFDRNRGCPTIFLEYLKNKSLRSNIYEGELKLDPVKRQICIIGLASAVKFLHSRRILHRNLNPETIWLDDNFYPKVFDFSTSRLFSFQNDTPKTVLKNEFVNYQAPELFESNFDKYDDSIDIFSLGRLIYLLITCFEPYQHPDDPYNICHGYGLQEPITNNKHPFFPDNMSKEFKELLERCWSFNPHDRPTAAEIYNRLFNDDGLIIGEVKTEKDLIEIKDYIDTIEKFERENPIKTNSKLSIMKTFELEIPFINTDTITNDVAEQIQTLLNFTSSNFASCNEADVLNLLIKMADNQSILQNDCLPKVLNFVNNSSQKGNPLANEFLMKVFGDYCVSTEIEEIQSGSCIKSGEAINIPPNIKKICKKAFAGNVNLTRINIPNSVTSIEDEAFSGCTNLLFANIPKSIEGTNLGKGVFKDCTNLKYIQIPPEITIIKKETFKDNANLTTLILNNGLETIGESAFNGCKSLTYVEIPKTVKLIQKEAFNNCTNLSLIFFQAMKKPKTEKKGLPSKYKALP